MNRSFFGIFTVNSRRFASIILLLTGTASWFFLLQYYIADSFANFQSNPFLVYFNPVLFYVVTCISAIGVSVIRLKYNRTFFGSLIAIGTLFTAILPLIAETVFVPVISIALGVSFGLFLPSGMAFMADSTVIQERARISGTVMSSTFILTVIIIMITRILGFDPTTTVLMFSLVRSISFIALPIDNFDLKGVEKEPLYTADYQTFLSYLIPWIMFILVSILAFNLFPPGSRYVTSSATVAIGQILRYCCIAIFSLASGITADRFGRKPSVIIGLITLGVSFAILGFTISDISIIIYLTASGVAWGSFFTMYLTIPGDLSTFRSRETFYTLIVVSLILLSGVPYIPGLADVTGYSSAFSQVLSLILFLAIIPIYRAKETLPDTKIRERRLKEYLEGVRKLVSETNETDES